MEQLLKLVEFKKESLDWGEDLARSGTPVLNREESSQLHCDGSVSLDQDESLETDTVGVVIKTEVEQDFSSDLISCSNMDEDFEIGELTIIKEEDIEDETDDDDEIAAKQSQTCTLSKKQLKEMTKYSKLIGRDMRDKSKVRKAPGKDGRWWKCVECGKQMQALETVRAHMSVHRPGNPFKCPTCSKTYPTHAQLTQHIKIHDLTLKKFKCKEPNCDAKFLTTSKLRDHTKTHDPEQRKAFPCPYPDCDKKYSSKGNVNGHVKDIHEGRVRKEWKCDECGQNFLSFPGWKHHTNRHKGIEKIKRFACYFCGLKRESFTSLLRHMSKHTKERPEQCDECGIWVMYLKMHQLVHKVNPLFPCTECSKQFKWKYDLKLHLKTMHGSNIEILRCPHEGCKYHSVRPKDLKRHERRIHLKIQDLECRHCHKKFSEKCNLDIHVMTHHSKKPLPFKCDICLKLFVTQSRLQFHKLTHSENKRFPCHLCEMKYKSSMGREVHLQRKHGVGNRKLDVNCYFCNKLYHGYSGYLKHLRDHTREKPYHCLEPGCETLWLKSAEILTYHLQVKHGKGKPLPPKRTDADPRFQCESCPRTYKHKGDLVKHTRVSHNKNGPLVYNCKQCKYSTRHKNMLSQHVKSIHLGIRHKCTICNKSYRKKQDLKRHYTNTHDVND